MPIRMPLMIPICVCLSLTIASCGGGGGGGDNDQPPGDTTPTGSVDKWGLWSNGVRLRGANIYQRRVNIELDGSEFMGPGPIGPPYTQQDMDNLAALGANYVNISHPGIYTTSSPYAVDADSQSNLDKLIAMATEADMFVVISFRTGPGRSEWAIFPGEDWYPQELFIDDIWTSTAAQDAWAGMWAYTASRYRDNPVVVGYDLMVEPNSSVSSLGQTSFDPDEFYPQYANTTYDWNPLAASITSAIRGVDADTPILMGGAGYSAVAWLPFIVATGDSKTVYTIHQYEPQDSYTHQEANGTVTYPGSLDLDYDNQPDTFDSSFFTGLMQNIDAFIASNGAPMAVNEFGVHRWVSGGDQYMDDQMSLFETRGMNHALWWWGPSLEAFNTEENAFTFIFGPDPSHTTVVGTSGLIEVIRKYWAMNTHRPSNYIGTQ
ncbi:MAG: glycoside hydrolase family 5 protein [Candidatus Thiodiazotropha sp. (ex Dulcina madagascariensis)]|nr:glycoside hydrolase family 5 protein [Candidatus Thiodiazotropha sp. (ex Dulcina madagascariensis)]